VAVLVLLPVFRAVLHQRRRWGGRLRQIRRGGHAKSRICFDELVEQGLHCALAARLDLRIARARPPRGALLFDPLDQSVEQIRLGLRRPLLDLHRVLVGIERLVDDFEPLAPGRQQATPRLIHPVFSAHDGHGSILLGAGAHFPNELRSV
jgi:hypothetical protein